MAKTYNASEEFLPSTYLTVLTLIGSGAKYGYEISKILEERGYREWVDIEMPSVYKALNELEKKNLIGGKKQQAQNRPSKKTYTLTNKGQRILKEQIRMCLRNPPKSKTLFDLGLSAVFLLSQEEVLDALREQVNNIENAIAFLSSHTETIEGIENFKKTEPGRLIGRRPVNHIKDHEPLAIVYALFDRPKTMLECRRAWLLKLIEQIESTPEQFGLNEK
jgi:DNA-binding PadR family transcriptional regulator